MNKEIKEILDKIKDGIGKFEEYDNNALLESDECEILLNYITNLQQENKELKKKITFNEKSRRKMQQSLMEQIENYKSRIDKAIDKLYCWGETLQPQFQEEMLKILQEHKDE